MARARKPQAAPAGDLDTFVTPEPGIWSQARRIGGALSPAQVSAIIGTADSGRPQQLVDITLDRFKAATDQGQTTGCLSGLRGEPFSGCAAGCKTACR